MMAFARVLVLLITGLLVAGCGEVAAPVPVVLTVSPRTVTLDAGASGEFTAEVNDGSSVVWSADSGMVTGSGATITYTAPVRAGDYTLTATSVREPDKFATARITVTGVEVGVVPIDTTIGAAGTLTFRAVVRASPDSNVTWSATGGTLSPAGNTLQWVAPIEGGTFTVTATSVIDPSRSALATAVVTPVEIVVATPSIALFRGQPVDIAAIVSGTEFTDVLWTATCGAITGGGTTHRYTAPTTAGRCQAIVRSALDTSKVDTMDIVVREPHAVTSLDDQSDGACTWTHCSLREALAAAQSASVSDSIALESLTPGAAIVLTSALPAITRDVHLVGGSGTPVVIDARGTAQTRRRVLTFEGASRSTVRRVMLRGGFTSTGGGVLVGGSAHVTLHDVTIANGVADGDGGGGVRVQDDGQLHMLGGELRANRAQGGVGGGLLLTSGAISLRETAVRDNNATGGAGTGGGLHIESALAVATITNTVISGNSASARGGGMHAADQASITIEGSTITANTAVEGGGLSVQDVTGLRIRSVSNVLGNIATGRAGGMLLRGATTADLVTVGIGENRAESGDGGGLYLDGGVKVTCAPCGIYDNRVVGAGRHGGGVYIGASAELAFESGGITGNVADVGLGGGVYANGGMFTARQTGVDENAAGGGGGIAAEGGSVIRLRESALRDNRALTGAGGGVLLRDSDGEFDVMNTHSNSAATDGGAYRFLGTGTARMANVRVFRSTALRHGGGVATDVPLVLVNSTIHGSSAGASGGGLHSSSPGGDSIVNATFSGNTAAIGGGLAIAGASTLTNVTVAENLATEYGAGIGGLSAGRVVLANSVLSNNLRGEMSENCATGGTATVSSLGHNLSSDATCAALTEPGDLLNTPARLRPLFENGGPAPSHLPFVDSPVIDAANPARCPATDQRGRARRNVCDIGAVEYDLTPLPSGAVNRRSRPAPLDR
jgi:CSLREA domain-containing protein